MLEQLFKSQIATVSDPYQCNCITDALAAAGIKFYCKLDIENPIIRINTAFKGCSSLEKISVLPRIYHN